jgi:ribosomal protein S27AE
MIIEVIIGSLTLSFLGSLLLGNSLVKKLRQWDLEDDEEPPMIYPFQEITLGSSCVKCGRKAVNATHDTNAYGPLIPKVCEEAAIKCKANKISHLHVKCNTCKATWFMATADSVIPEKENVIRNVKNKSKNKS